MIKKLTQKAFNEDMFYAIYRVNMMDSETVKYLVESALDELREQGYDVPNFNPETDDYMEMPELMKLLKRFNKRFEKLTGYDFE
tara:strand:- start:169 stop:420 length:252 start_codon:yes stop_codon:yes gene_type:complete